MTEDATSRGGEQRRQFRPAYRVAVTERATVVARGESLEAWWVRVNDGWVRATEHPTANCSADDAPDEALACPAGTVWRRVVELRLEAGTQLLQRRSWPRTRHLSVMGYLQTGAPGSQRTLKERRFVVSGNYCLAPIGRMRTQTLTSKRRSASPLSEDTTERQP